MKKKELFAVGEWVQGETWDKQSIYGYIVKIENPEDIIKVFIVNSANSELNGRMIRVLARSLEKVPESTMEAGSIEQLIDLALITKDEQWFEELFSLKGEQYSK